MVVRPIANAPRIVALDEKAEGLGLHKGLALADARARVPELRVAEEDQKADAALMEHLAAWATRWTPFAAVAPGEDPVPCDLALDITGCAHLFGGEAAMLAEVGARLTAMGFCAQGAVAPTLRAARALARFRPGARPGAGEAQDATARLPITALELQEGATRRLQGLGFATLEDLWAQPRAALAARFGAVLPERLDEMAGHVDAPISPARPVPLHMAERRFAEPMGDMETARGVLLDLARDLCGLLDRQGLGARRLEASFFRSDGAVRHIAAATARPLRDPARMAGLFRERLDALADPLDPGFGFDVLRLSLMEGDPWQAHQAAFDRRTEEEDLSALVDTLSARLGAHRVMRFSAGDTYLPEGAAGTRAALSDAMPGADGSPEARRRAARDAGPGGSCGGAREAGRDGGGWLDLGAGQRVSFASDREAGRDPGQGGKGGEERAGAGGERAELVGALVTSPASAPSRPNPAAPVAGRPSAGGEGFAPPGSGSPRRGVSCPELQNPALASLGFPKSALPGSGLSDQGLPGSGLPNPGQPPSGLPRLPQLGAALSGPAQPTLATPSLQPDASPHSMERSEPAASAFSWSGPATLAQAWPDRMWPQALPPALPATRPLTLFARPEPVEALAEVPDGPPLRFRWRRALHEVARAEGPERIAPEWWLEEEAFTRDYFRVEDKEGRRFWLYREGTYGRETARPRWFLHGLFA